MTYSLNDDLDDMEPNPDELGQDAIVALPVEPETTEPNPGATKEMIFTDIPGKRELPSMDKEFTILGTRGNKALDLSELAKSVAVTQTMSREQAELAEQLSPGFVNEDTPLGMYTAVPTKTLAEDSIVDLNARLDKEVVELLASCESVQAAVTNGCGIVMQDIELEITEYIHKSSTNAARIASFIKENPGFRVGSNRLATDYFQSDYTLGLDEFLDNKECGLALFGNQLIWRISRGHGGFVIINSRHEITPTDEGSDIITSEVKNEDYHFITVGAIVTDVLGDNVINFIRDIGTLLCTLKLKSEFMLTQAKEKINSDTLVENRSEKIKILIEHLTYLNRFNISVISANNQIRTILETLSFVNSNLGKLSEKLTNIGIEQE